MAERVSRSSCLSRGVAPSKACASPPPLANCSTQSQQGASAAMPLQMLGSARGLWGQDHMVSGGCRVVGGCRVTEGCRLTEGVGDAASGLDQRPVVGAEPGSAFLRIWFLGAVPVFWFLGDGVGVGGV